MPRCAGPDRRPPREQHEGQAVKVMQPAIGGHQRAEIAGVAVDPVRQRPFIGRHGEGAPPRGLRMVGEPRGQVGADEGLAELGPNPAALAGGESAGEIERFPNAASGMGADAEPERRGGFQQPEADPARFGDRIGHAALRRGGVLGRRIQRRILGETDIYDISAR